MKIAYLLIFRIQDPESSGSEDPDGKSHEGRNWLYKVLFQLWLILQNTVADSNHHHHDGMTQQDDYWYFNANLGARTGQLRAR